MNCSAGSVTVPPGTTATGVPVSRLLPVDVAVTDWWLGRPLVAAAIASPRTPYIQSLRSVRLRDARVFVYVQTTSPFGIVNVVAGPGVDDDGVAPVQATVVV